ncbi:MAG: hypothetical protein KDK00_07270 [Rhodobacteraceae bacterium]|nr:hypothetical protein [Paracoccaceae bacterium]
MQQNRVFNATLWASLFIMWLVSGEAFLDWAFTMPDIGRLDDALLGLVAGAENAKAALGLPDMFQALRAAIHAATGLG